MKPLVYIWCQVFVSTVGSEVYTYHRVEDLDIPAFVIHATAAFVKARCIMVGLCLQHVLTSKVVRELRGPDMLCDGVPQQLEERKRSGLADIHCIMRLKLVSLV